MLAQWIGDVIGEMHKNKITASELANEIGWHAKYLSAILNGHRSPKNAEQTVKQALARILGMR